MEKFCVFFACFVTDYGFCLPSAHQPQTVQLAYMFGSCGKQINPGGVDAAVAQHIGQSHDISVDLIKSFREQMTQVVGKHF